MVKVLLDDIANNREAFEKLHHGEYISSSIIGAIVGENPYWSALEEWCVRTGKMPRENIGNKPVVRLGRTLEPLVAELAAEKLSRTAVPVNQVLQHRSLDWAIASPDYRLSSDTGAYSLLECKTTGYRGGKLWSDSTAPWTAQIQLQWQLGIDDEADDEAYLAAIVAGDVDNVFTPRINRSREIFEQLVAIAQQFLQNVKDDIPPNAGPNDKEAITLLCKHSQQDEVELSDMQVYLNQYLELKEELKERKSGLSVIEDNIKQIEFRIRQRMGDKARARIGDKIFEVKITEHKESKPRLYSVTRVNVRDA